MSSKRDAIAAAIVVALSAGGKPSGLNVHRFRARPITVDQLPAQLVYLVSESVETGPGQARGTEAKSVRSLTVRVETRIDAGSSTAPDAAIDQYLTWAVQTILTDPTLGGVAVETVEESTQWTAEELNKVYAAAQTDFVVKYITDAANPDAHTR